MRRPDVIPPDVSCPDSLILEMPLGTCSRKLEFGSIGVEDNCPRWTVTQTFGPANNSLVTIPGSYPITYDIKDVGNNVVQCQFQAQVLDVEYPTITCPPDVQQIADPMVCSSRITFGSATASDNCDYNVFQSYGPRSGDLVIVGYHQVYFTATDSSKNSVVCVTEIAVLDDQKPFVSCREFEATVGTVNWITPLRPEEIAKSMSDNCGFIDQLFLNKTSIDYLDAMAGFAFVQLTVTDFSYNEESCVAKLPVVLGSPVIKPFIGQGSFKEGNSFVVSWYDVGIFQSGDTINIWLTDKNDVFLYTLASSARYLDFSTTVFLPVGTIPKDDYYLVHGNISGTGDSGGTAAFLTRS